MVRATRATQLAMDDPLPPRPVSPPSPAKKIAVKKRKRSDADDAILEQEQHQLTSTDTDNEQNGHATAGESEREGDKEERPVGKRQKTKQSVKEEDEHRSTPPSRHHDSGDVPIASADADRLHSVLDAIDPDNLLARQIEISTENASSSDDAPLTLRRILQSASQYNGRLLRDAIFQLAPERANSRASLSEVHADQAKFIEVAQSLLQEIALRQSGAVDISRTTLDADMDDGTKTLVDDDTPMSQYALHLHLPTGDYFTSAAKLSVNDASTMLKGQASLVSVQPSTVIDPEYLPKLGSYSRPIQNPVVTRNRLPNSQTTSVGTFLDYGPFTSFAPNYDSELSEITQDDYSELLYRKRLRLLARRRTLQELDRKRIEANPVDNSPEDQETPNPEPAIDPFLELDDDLRAALEQLQLESGIDDLLEKNARAMQRLIVLQNERYRQGESAPVVEVGAEEWNLAHDILESLSSLTSLRPRRVGSSSAPLIPPTTILRALHRTLPTDPAPGWRGTLQRERDGAYRDNSTVTADAAPYVNPAPVPPPQHTKPVPPPAVQQYPSYSQPYQRPGLPATTSSYFGPQYYPQYGNTPAKPAVPVPQNQYYYPYPQYAGYTTYGQHAAYPQQAATPQPPRVIPNAARPAAPYGNGWSTPMGTGTTLPPHLRKTGVATPGTPGTPTTYGMPTTPNPATPVYPPMQVGFQQAQYAGWSMAPKA